ncbi:MAG: hypothetical protein KGM39_02435 [Actinomycetales bacterium]|nr:hypothetical protein [Actinomycetales bacterium]
MSEKPEWFQITEGDEKPEAKKSKRGFLKIAAVALPLVVVGAVAVGANGEEDHVPKFSPTITSNTSTSNLTSQASATTTSKVSINSTTVSTISNPSTTSPANPGKPGIGVQPPKGGGDDDHEGFDGGERKRFDGDNHEGRENHREGSFSTKN